MTRRPSSISTRTLLRLGFTVVATLLAGVPLRAEIVAVSSVVFNGYARERLPDRSYKPERYVFGEGGCISRLVNDPTLGKLTFAKIGRIVAAPLAQENYLPAKSSAEAELLIVVFWGSTQGSSESDPSMSLDVATAAIADLSRTNQASQSSQSNQSQGVSQNSPEGAAYESALIQLSMANRERDRLDARNARILGYEEALDRANFAQHMSYNRDVLQELGGNRYFVVLQAYDFRTAVKTKKLKPMWTVRLSVSEQGDFAEAIDRMAWSATRYFGRDSDGLRRQRTKEGTVDLAPIKVLETVPAK